VGLPVWRTASFFRRQQARIYHHEMLKDQSLTRRSFLSGVTASSVVTVVGGATTTAAQQTSTYFELLRQPDSATAYNGPDQRITLTCSSAQWQASGINVETAPEASELKIRISAPGKALTHVHLRWNLAVDANLRFLGDHWERSYGDLAWRTITPERVMPWYFAAYDGSSIHGYGVETGAGAMCFWQADPEGISLWLDVSNGGSGVELGQRQLHAATIVTRRGEAGEDPLIALQKFCQTMCAKPRPVPDVIYGTNDWYYAYGNSSREQILEDAELAAALCPHVGPRPFTVIDDGWTNKAKFPDMQRLTSEIRERGARPGIWIRPLIAPQGTDASLLMPDERFGNRKERISELAYDPTIPDALEAVRVKLRALKSWGYELVKHDFSTYDLLGQWGFEMGARPTLPGWRFHDRSRTNAEIISDLYKEIRTVLGEEIQILGCNTVGHLGAGIFDLSRTGDDTSGKIWERTRRMGVNTISFRLPQHRSFFAVDGDCVAVTKAVAWRETAEWLRFVAASGTALFISVEKSAMGTEQKQALKEAFAVAASKPSLRTATDWFESTTPERWAEKRFTWCGPDGAYPFSI
jgi:alpha-galactosidase